MLTWFKLTADEEEEEEEEEEEYLRYIPDQGLTLQIFISSVFIIKKALFL
jgi:hypothetical protein